MALRPGQSVIGCKGDAVLCFASLRMSATYWDKFPGNLLDPKLCAVHRLRISLHDMPMLSAGGALQQGQGVIGCKDDDVLCVPAYIGHVSGLIL